MQCNCHGTGVIVAELFPGAVLVQPCGCAAAAAARKRAERELREMLEEIQHVLNRPSERLGRQKGCVCLS